MSSKSLTDIVRDVIESGNARVPIFDGSAEEIRKMVSDGSIDITRLEQIIERDPALSGELLRLANSSFYGGLEKIVTIREAVMRAGAKRCAELATVVAQKQAYKVKDPELQKLAEKLWAHALAVALGSDWLAQRLDIPEIRKHTMLAGLLHDVGKLLVLLVIDDLKSEGGVDFEFTTSFILEAMDSLHCEQGQFLLEQWGIPGDYARVTREHHDPDFADSDLLLIVVRIADQAANRLGMGLEPCPDLVLAASAEAQALRVSDLVLAELEVQLEDLVEPGMGG